MERELEIAVESIYGGPDGGQVELAGGWWSEGGINQSEVQMFIATVVMFLLYGFIGGALLYTVINRPSSGQSTATVYGGGLGGGGGAQFTLESPRLDR